MNLKTLSDDQLVARMKQIAGQAETIRAFQGLKASPHGKILLAYLNERRAAIRALYCNLNPGEPSFVPFAARIQGAEEEVATMLHVLENSGDAKKVLDREMGLCSSEADSRKGKDAQRDFQIVSNKIVEAQ